ncbi:DUF4337 family protein [Sphingomonas sp. CROZ-RG-20F-R02-07]|uniref:DUF4337 family protein n=1 Tax=Sphingomonas sp. CROZ-RG-20F-R02-07 TaxID=2914832 RepID=UPI001F57A5FA|nr:DUF4337 family protein [Sphingomonas sp. CROZ-RG-20F-R02-07]
MAEEEFEIRGAHEDVLEREIEEARPMAQRIALFSAVLATLGAVVSFLGGHTQNEALYYKNEAVLLKARASDDWAYYQAEDIKAHLVEATTRSGPTDADRADIARYRTRAQDLRRDAERLDVQSEEANAESVHALAPHTKLAMAMTAIQVAIALASIAALTHRSWLLWGGVAFAAIGIATVALAWT